MFLNDLIPLVTHFPHYSMNYLFFLVLNFFNFSKFSLNFS